MTLLESGAAKGRGFMTVLNMTPGEVRELDAHRLIVPNSRATPEKLLARLSHAEASVD